MSDSTPPAPQPKSVSVLFVCLGNICRSTMSEGVFRSLTSHAAHPLINTIDSCGTGAYHLGSSPDRRTMATLKANGITDYSHSARRFKASTDFAKFEYIFAMDRDNLGDLDRLRKREVQRLGSDEGVGKVMLFGEFSGRKGKSGKVMVEEVEDPYYGGDDGFEVAYEQAVRFSKTFLEKLEAGELS